MSKKAKIEVICPSCGESRIVCYAQSWNIKVGNCSGDCYKCASKKSESNSGRFKKGMISWNKGMLGYGKGHGIYYDAKGEKNPFWNKHHTKETKKIMREKKLGIKTSYETRQKMSLYHADVSGKNNPNWKNGKSFEEYGAEFDNALKEQVRFRDHYKCQICGCSQLENGRQLDVHHKDYNKKNLNWNNLISLCRSCHMKTNYNREEWKEYFKIKIEEKVKCQ